MFSSNSSTVSGDANYIESVFSTHLYTGNSSTQTINNGIDLAGKGGMVWQKSRNTVNSYAHRLSDTNRGAGNTLRSESTAASAVTGGTSSFTSTGFTLVDSESNQSTDNYASWTFRKQPKFFDVVTYTGNDVAGRQIAHSLGVAPGMIIIKCTSNDYSWYVYHRSLGANQELRLNTTGAATTGAFFPTTPTSSDFYVKADGGVNGSGETYVAYLFAHDAGGFGLAGTDNVISCGSFTAGTGSVNLGYEPQWIMFKGLTGSNGWIMFDTMRGWPTEPPNKLLQAQTSAVEGDTFVNCQPTATGFNYNFSPDCIYIAIRRGPMKVPTDGTKVYNAIARTGTGAAATVTGVGFTPDWLFTKSRSDVTGSMVADRLRGAPYLQTTSTNAEADNSAVIDSTAFSTTMDGFRLSASSTLNNWDPYTYINYLFKRAPGFFDEVCYTGTGSARTVAHNLAAVPELMIVKQRGDAGEWPVYHSSLGATKFISLNRAFSEDTLATMWNNTAPTASVFTVGTSLSTSAATYVSYLFATCPGVSKVGTYTGTGATQTINCGFAAGARFVLIKRVDSTGDWYVWDSARGIIAGNDPYLLLNSTAAEVTSTDYIDPVASGFEISSTAPAAINASGGQYLFFAVS